MCLLTIKGYFKCLYFTAFNHHNLNQFQKNVLILFSENNKAFGSSYAQKQANYFPVHQIIRIDDTGHEMIYFKWNSVYPKAMAYLNSL